MQTGQREVKTVLGEKIVLENNIVRFKKIDPLSGRSEHKVDIEKSVDLDGI